MMYGIQFIFNLISLLPVPVEVITQRSSTQSKQPTGPQKLINIYKQILTKMARTVEGPLTDLYALLLK